MRMVSDSFEAAWAAYEREMAISDFHTDIADHCFPDPKNKYFKTPELDDVDGAYRRPFNVDDETLPEYVKLEDGTIVYHSIEDEYLIDYLSEVALDQAGELFDYSWDQKEQDKLITEIFYKCIKDEKLLAECREFIRKKDAERGIIYDPDYFTRKQNAA